MAWKKVYQNRLKKLADHLMTGKLGHRVFDFSKYNIGKYDGNTTSGCGYAGCAIGECPIIFKQWKFGKDGGEPLIKWGYTGVGSARIFFSLEHPEENHLFLPETQDIKKYGGKTLPHKATRKQVARNIYAFIKIKAGK